MNYYSKIVNFIEAIKGFNIEFNEATSQKIANSITPAIHYIFITEIITPILIFLVTITATMLGYKLIKAQIQLNRDIENNKHARNNN